MFDYAFGQSSSNSVSEQLLNKGRIPMSHVSNGKVLSKAFPRTFFQGLDPAYHGVSMQPDYSLDSHDRDLEVKEMNEGESKVDNGKT